MSRYLTAELACAVLFGLHVRAAVRRGRWQLMVLLSAALYGLLLEHFNQTAFGSYRYSGEFAVNVGRCPAVIGLVWAMIIVGVFSITDVLGVSPRLRPLVDATLALALDVAFDAIAIRTGMWTWIGVPLDEGFFGVPTSNFYGWFVVVAVFSVVVRWTNTLPEPARSAAACLSALPSVCLQFLGISIYVVLQVTVTGFPLGGVLVGSVLIAAPICTYRAICAGRPTPASAGTLVSLRSAFLMRLTIHLAFLGGLVFVAEYQGLALFAVAGAALGLDFGLVRRSGLALQAPQSTVVDRSLAGDGPAPSGEPLRSEHRSLPKASSLPLDIEGVVT